MITMAILGLGSRGAETYGRYAMNHPDQIQITAVCDIDAERAKRYGREFGVKSENVFTDGMRLVRKPLAQLLVIASDDRAHYEYAITAMRTGYHLLLEKPVSPVLSECLQLRDTAIETGRMVAVCHVMRYTSFYRKLKELLAEGVIGRTVAIEQIEDVAYWHMAHAFVRGTFRNSNETSPMILQKCCHDMDLLVYLTGGRFTSLSSIGELSVFTRHNAPKGSSERCCDCKVTDCPYNAADFYLKNFRALPQEKRNCWPYFQLAADPDEEKLAAALQNGPYGRCVYRCDNNVVDHQFVNITFDNGIMGTLTMCGFANNGGRRTHVYGTRGELILDEQRRTIEVGVFGQNSYEIAFDSLSDDFSGHGGGDNAMMREVVQAIEQGTRRLHTSITESIESHLMCFAAEQSRRSGGRAVSSDAFRTADTATEEQSRKETA